VSTPTEKTPFCPSFLKPAKKKALQTCNIAGFLSPRFSGRAGVGGRGKKGRYCEDPDPGKKIPVFDLFTVVSDAEWVKHGSKLSSILRPLATIL
jgi:hypothetical protein